MLQQILRYNCPHQTNTAFQTGDVATLEAMITASYQHTNGSSKAIGKEAWLNYLRKRKKAIDSGELEVLGYEMSELGIEFYGATAIVTAKVSVKNKTEDGTVNNAYRVTNIWINESGVWKRAGFHDGKINL